jgi:hypothetical protein
MKKLVILSVLAGGWYVHSNDLVPDLGLADEWSRAKAVASRAGNPGRAGAELDRIQRMEADLDAQGRYLDERAARLQSLKAGVTPPRGAIGVKAIKGVQADPDEYNREVVTLNDGYERFRVLYATYRDEVDRYNAHVRRGGGAPHRPIPPRTDSGVRRRVQRVAAAN